jgi:phosphopantetheinyl transferase
VRRELQKVHEAHVAGGPAPRPVVRVALARLAPGSGAYRAQHAAVRELLVELAGRTLGESTRGYVVRTRESGEPVLYDGDAPASGVSISLSHSRLWIAAGLAREGRLGIDIEQENPRRRIAAMADWMGWPACREPGDFYRAWTYREACIKCRGGELPPAGAAPLPVAAEDASVVHHAHGWRHGADLHGCSVFEAERPLRLGWRRVEMKSLRPW